MSTTFHALRLHPNSDLKLSLQAFLTSHPSLRSAFIVTAVGSLNHLAIRLAHDPINKENAVLTRHNECFEITSMVGTLSQQGMHVHLCVADQMGKMLGGHLLEGCKVFTTCELVLGNLGGVVFGREFDKETGCAELVVREASGEEEDGGALTVKPVEAESEEAEGLGLGNLW